MTTYILGYDEITKEVKKSLNCDKDVLLFALNATGKTRISYSFNVELDNGRGIEALCYNSIVEDYFTWDNENKTIGICKNCWLFDFICNEGLDSEIIKNYSSLVGSKIEPKIDFNDGMVKFYLATGDEKATESIKISKGEETLFKWTVFYTALEHVIEILIDKEDDRSTEEFNNLKYVIIDDPVSSLDDYRLCTLSTQLLRLIQIVHEKQLKIHFLISTHHTLFFNLIFNALKKREQRNKSITYYLSKVEGNIKLEELDNQKSFTQHLASLQEIKNAIKNNNLQKKHFNMFRGILGKTSIFLGYKQWQDLFDEYSNKDMFKRLINMNSHEKFSELGVKYLEKEQIDCFEKGFDYFVDTYKIKI